MRQLELKSKLSRCFWRGLQRCSPFSLKISIASMNVSKTHLWLSLVSLIWGLNFSIMKVGVLTVGPLAFAFLRFALSGLLMFIVLLLVEKNPWVSWRDVPYFFFMGILGFGAYQPLWSYGLKLSLASHSALILSISPVVVSLITFFRKEEWVRGINFLGVLLSFLGVVFLVLPQGGFHFSSSIFLGDSLTFIGAVCWGLYSYFGKRVVSKYSPLKSGTWSILLGLVTMFPVCFRDFFRIERNDFQITLILVLLYGTVLSSLVSYLIWMRGLREIGAARTSSYQYLTQVVGVIGAWMVFREPLHWQLFLGMFLVSLGLWLSQRKPSLP
ncbi:MAG: DMT family transporter [Atribacterota bacterium]|nr:DMT family transporter [Atribacterota bacterium]